ncbi:MAG: divalent-cation tolerance protein CutA [bacterium]
MIPSLDQDQPGDRFIQEEAKIAEYIQILTTAEKREDAKKIAQTLVEKRLAACVQIVGPILSTYWWKKEVETVEEWLCIIKSKTELYEELEKSIRQIHPYEVPEILAMPVIRGSKDYLGWLGRSVKEK